ncbi:MAG TPA: ferritin-like domain-containing protein [Thermosynechococcaceae cyanobacterium]
MIAGASEIEAPIRGYSQESRSYLEQLHPEMANFMGGSVAEDGSMLTLGLWEKEERQHAPTFSKIYQQLTGKKLILKPNPVQGYIPTNNPHADLQQHVLMRITTEWGAVSVYLWLMAHATGELQQAIAQPLQDEINHLAKFWGFSRWAFADSYLHQLQGSTRNILALLKHHKTDRTHGNDLLGHTHRLHNTVLAAEITFTLLRVMVRLRLWNRELSHSYLKHLFGQSSMSDRPLQVKSHQLAA